MAYRNVVVKVDQPARRRGYTEFKLSRCHACNQPRWEAEHVLPFDHEIIKESYRADNQGPATYLRMDAVTGKWIFDARCPVCCKRFLLPGFYGPTGEDELPEAAAGHVPFNGRHGYPGITIVEESRRYGLVEIDGYGLRKAGELPYVMR